MPTLQDLRSRLYPVDRANHFARGALVAAVVAVPLMALALVLLRAPAHGALLLAALGALLAAWGAGLWKERTDQAANDIAALLGQPAPHAVEQGDVDATVAGGYVLAWALAGAGLLLGTQAMVRPPLVLLTMTVLALAWAVALPATLLLSGPAAPQPEPAPGPDAGTAGDGGPKPPAQQ